MSVLGNLTHMYFHSPKFVISSKHVYQQTVVYNTVFYTV